MSESQVTYCRLCAEPTPKEQLICKEDKIAVTSKMIIKMLWINIDVSNSNALPNTICLFCFDKLEKTYTFLQNVRTAQRKLSIIFSRKSNSEIVDCTIENMNVMTENIAKPVDEDWESFQVTKKQVQDDNQTVTAPESSIVDSNLFKYNVNVVKQEIHSDDNTPLGKCNVIDTEGFNTTDCNLRLQSDVLELEQTALHIERSTQQKLPAVFSKKSKHKIVDCNIENMNVIAINAAKPIDKGWESFEVTKKEVEDESSRVDLNLSKYVNVVKEEIYNDETPLGECNIDIDTFNWTDRDLSFEVINVEETASLFHCTIENENVIAENGVYPIEEDFKPFQVIKKEAEDETQTETVAETTSFNSNLFQCNIYVKREIHRDDDPLLCERNIIVTENFDPTDIDLQSHLSAKKKKKKAEKKKPKKKDLKNKNIEILDVKQSKFNEATWLTYTCCCAECGVQCENIASLRQHSLQTHSCCCVFKCSNCSKVLPSYKSFIHHAHNHTNKLKNCCEFCNKRFNNATTMKKHLTLAHRYDCLTMCPNCGMSFETLDELQNHIFTYSKSYKDSNRKEQPIQSNLKCEHCNKEFESFDNLQQHKLVHAESGKDFPCHVCGEKFFTDSMLSTHMLTHEATKLYECEVCSKSYKTKYSLQSHIKSIHSCMKPFACEQCGKTFRSKTRLYFHLRDHRKALYNCVYCQQNFTSHSYFKKHMEHSHNIKVEDKQ